MNSTKAEFGGIAIRKALFFVRLLNNPQIRRNLAAVNPSVYLPDVAGTLINVAIYHLQFALDREHSIRCATEAIMILRPIVENAPYIQKYLQTAIRVLQGWGLNSEDIEQMLV